MVHPAVARCVSDEDAQADGTLPGELRSVLQPAGDVFGDVIAWKVRVQR